MTRNTFMLAGAADQGRAGRDIPKTRQEILLALLYKRAEARQRGLDSQEKLLRDQILWALPMNEPADA